MRKSIPAVLRVLWVLALVGAYPYTAPAQDKAQITDVFKEHLAVDDPRLVSVRQYDVPPGWVCGRRSGDPSAARQTDDHEEFE